MLYVLRERRKSVTPLFSVTTPEKGASVHPNIRKAKCNWRDTVDWIWGYNECISTTALWDMMPWSLAQRQQHFLAAFSFLFSSVWPWRRGHPFPPKRWQTSVIKSLGTGISGGLFFNMVMNLWAPFEAGSLEISWWSVSVSRTAPVVTTLLPNCWPGGYRRNLVRGEALRMHHYDFYIRLRIIRSDWSYGCTVIPRLTSDPAN